MIMQEHGYLGPYLCILNPRDTQLMVFKDTDNGPFWMSRAEQSKKRQDMTKSTKIKQRHEHYGKKS